VDTARAVFVEARRVPPDYGLAGLAAASPTATSVSLPSTVGIGGIGLVLVGVVAGGTLAGWMGARRAAALKPAVALRRG